MTLFVWQDIGRGLTDSYHSGGGVLVIAESESRARELIEATRERKYGDDKPLELGAPTYSVPVDAQAEHVIIFPDAGCC